MSFNAMIRRENSSYMKVLTTRSVLFLSVMYCFDTLSTTSQVPSSSIIYIYERRQTSLWPKSPTQPITLKQSRIIAAAQRCIGSGLFFGKFRQFWATNRRIGRQDSWQQCSFWTTWGLNSQLLEPKTVIYHSELIGKWQYNSGFTNWVSHSLLCRQIWNHCKKFSYQDKNLKIHILQHGDVGNLFLKMIDLLHKWITDV